MPHLAIAVIRHRLADFFIGIHHKRPAAGDWFVNRFATQQQGGRILGAGDTQHLTSAVEQANLCRAYRLGIRDDQLLQNQ